MPLRERWHVRHSCLHCHIPKGQQTPFRWRPASPAGDKDVDRDLDMLRQAETRKVTRRSYLNDAGLSRPIS